MKTWQEYAGNQGNATTTWNYDSRRGWLTSKAYANGNGPSYQYYPSGRLQKRTWARGVQTTYTYSRSGDLTEISYSDDTPATRFDYNRRGRVKHAERGPQTQNQIQSDFEYNNLGQLTRTDVSPGLVGYSQHNEFDGMNRRSAHVLKQNGVEKHRIGYTYDPASRLDSVIVGNHSATYQYRRRSARVENVHFKEGGTYRMTTTRLYDTFDRLRKISNLPTTGSEVTALYAYNQANRRTKLTEADGAEWDFTYDYLGQVTNAKKTFVDDTPVPGMAFEYDFDDIGNRKSTRRNEDPDRLATYTVNTLNQYTRRDVPNRIDVMGRITSGTVRVNGELVTPVNNLFHKTVTLPNVGTRAVQDVTVSAEIDGQLITETGKRYLPGHPEEFNYDGDGNLATDGRWHYIWDGENRLIKADTNPNWPANYKFTVFFDYDHAGRLVRRRIETIMGRLDFDNGMGPSTGAVSPSWTTYFLYDGWNVIAEANGAQTILRKYAWGTDLSGSMQGAGGVGGLLMCTDNTGAQLATHFYGYDGNGNVTMTVNAADGTTSARYEYGPFGEMLRASGEFARRNPYRFSTKLYDEVSDFYYYGYRFYNPDTGRWLNSDPIQENGGLNLYGFVRNRPLDVVDPIGLALYAFDGTGTRYETQTHVSILHGIYEGPAFYRSGVGDRSWKVVGGFTGAGGRARLEWMYRRFLEAYPEDKDIDIIGFSRGAALAREFANMVYERGDGSGLRFVGKTRHKVWGKPCVVPKIRFIGLFDTVGSFGWPGNAINIGVNLKLPPNVEHSAQAVAKDEHRSKFPLTPLSKPGPGQVYSQEIFPGDHSDIGGGWESSRNWLSLAPLEYIWKAGRAAGVPFGPLPPLDYYDDETPHDMSNDWKYRMDENPPRDFEDVWTGRIEGQ